MKRRMTENIPLKIMSILVGILVWILVVNIDDPIRTVTHVITNVDLVNVAFIDNEGLMCLPDEDQQSVRVHITGKRKTVEKIRTQDIVAVADLQQALSLETDPVMVPITVTCDGISASNIEIMPRNLKIHLQKKMTQEFAVSVASGDSKPATGYEIGTLTSSPEKIQITGPSSLINKIGVVSAGIDVNGAVSDVTKETTPVIYDKNGDRFTEIQMRYLYFSNVTVTARLWKIRSNVNLMADYTGKPAEGYYVDSVVTIPDVVSVAGDENALSTLTSNGNSIEIPAENIDITGKKVDYEEKITLTGMLPEGIKLISGSSEDVWVRVVILPEGSRAYRIPSSSISVLHQPEGMQSAFVADGIEVRVRKTDEKLPDLKAEEILLAIDLENIREGSYELPVSVDLPDGYELVEKVSAEVTVSQISSVDSAVEQGEGK